MNIEKNYNELASRTENTQFDGKTYSKTLYEQGLNLAIETAKLLDIFKKHFFYNRTYSQEQFLDNIQSVEMILNEIKQYDLNKVLNNEYPTVTFGKKDEEALRLFHMILGVITEGGEIGETLQKYHQGEQLDWVNIAEENGDIDWYQAIPYNILKEKGETLTEIDVRTKNINKLAKRYGEKYADYNANHRDLEAEREILEK